MSGNQEAECKYLERLTRLFCRALLKGVLVLSPQELGDLTQVQLNCLHYVNRHRETTVSDIADGLGISRAAATNLVERLVRKDYVVRQDNPEDRRQVLISLSPEGVRVLDRILAKQEDHFRRAIEGMADRDVAALRQGLQAFLEASLLEEGVARNTCARCGIEHFAHCPVGAILGKLDIDVKH